MCLQCIAVPTIPLSLFTLAHAEKTERGGRDLLSRKGGRKKADERLDYWFLAATLRPTSPPPTHPLPFFPSLPDLPLSPPSFSYTQYHSSVR